MAHGARVRRRPRACAPDRTLYELRGGNAAVNESQKFSDVVAMAPAGPSTVISGLCGRGQAVSAGGPRRPGRVHGHPGGGPRSGARATPGHGQLVRRAVRPDRLRRGACAFLHGEDGAPAARPAGQSQERIAASETMSVASRTTDRIDRRFRPKSAKRRRRPSGIVRDLKKSAFALMTGFEKIGILTEISGKDWYISKGYWISSEMRPVRTSSGCV